MVQIKEIVEANEHELQRVNNLIPQLSESADILSFDDFTRIVNSPSTHIYLAEENTQILGMLSLVIFPIPTGIRAWVEDVVVQQEARGMGIGRLLTLHAISESKRLGASKVDLTSRPGREAANKLYQSVGFQMRQTNVYRYSHDH